MLTLGGSPAGSGSSESNPQSLRAHPIVSCVSARSCEVREG